VLAEAGVQLTRLDAFEADVRWPELEEIGGLMVRVTDLGQRDALLSALQTGDRVFQWHEDTFDLPAGADLLVARDDVPNQAFRLGGKAWAVQFHFELDAQGVEAWLRVTQPTLSRVGSGPRKRYAT